MTLVMEWWGQVSQRCSRWEWEERKYRRSRASDRLPLHPDWSWGMGAFGEVWLGKGRQKEGSPGTVFPMAEEWECLVCSGRGQWPVKGREGMMDRRRFWKNRGEDGVGR